MNVRNGVSKCRASPTCPRKVINNSKRRYIIAVARIIAWVICGVGGISRARRPRTMVVAVLE